MVDKTQDRTPYGRTAEPLTPAARFAELAREHRASYMTFVAELGRSGPIRWFTYPGERFSMWWFSLTAEKAVLKSDAYRRLIEALAYEEQGSPTLAAPAAGPLLSFIRGWRTYLRWVARILYTKAAMRGSRRRKRELEDKSTVIVSYFPLLDRQAAEQGVFVNRYIPALQRALEARGPGSYAHVCIRTELEGIGFVEGVRLAARLARRRSLLLVEEFARPRHLVSVALMYLYFSLRYLAVRGRIRDACVYRHGKGSIDAWPMHAADLDSSLSGPVLASSLWYVATFREVVRRLGRDAVVASVCEMQWWERPLYAFARGRGLPTVGIQHTHVPLLLLNYFNDASELTWQDRPESCPVPDLMAATGQLPRRLLIEDSWPEDRVFVWGAPRFEALAGADGGSIPFGQRERVLICALPIDRREADALLRMMADAFREPAPYSIVLKSHPAFASGELVRRHLGASLGETFEVVDQPLETLLANAKGMIVTGSSSGMFALAQGCPVIIPRFFGILDINPLSYVSDVPIFVDTPADLRLACDRAATSETPQVPLDRSLGVLRDYMSFPPSDDDYLTSLETAVRTRSVKEEPR